VLQAGWWSTLATSAPLPWSAADAVSPCGLVNTCSRTHEATRKHGRGDDDACCTVPAVPSAQARRPDRTASAEVTCGCRHAESTKRGQQATLDFGGTADLAYIVAGGGIAAKDLKLQVHPDTRILHCVAD